MDLSHDRRAELPGLKANRDEMPPLLTRSRKLFARPDSAGHFRADLLPLIAVVTNRRAWWTFNETYPRVIAKKLNAGLQGFGFRHGAISERPDHARNPWRANGSVRFGPYAGRVGRSAPSPTPFNQIVAPRCSNTANTTCCPG